VRRRFTNEWVNKQNLLF